jgi:nicotinamidase-related amidase
MDLDKHALVLIDLQRRTVARETHPHAAAAVVASAARLAAAFRQAGQPVIAVRMVNLDAPDLVGDQIVEEVAGPAGELRVTKHTMGAFHGTPLDLYLRRLGVTGIVLAGLMTNFGVESTARAAHEHGYRLVFAEDAMSSFSDGAHAFAIETIFPRLGVVASTETIVATLAERAPAGG